MINQTQLKICGLKTAADAAAAAAIGADYLGFIFHPASPRHLGFADYAALAPDLPPLKRVGVTVYTNPDDLARIAATGVDYVQVHFPNETPFFEAAMWTDIVPPNRLWLAPRIPPGRELDLAFVPLADTFVLDTFDPERAGGTGRTGDWENFVYLRKKFIKVSWVLAGGLNPENIAGAVAATAPKIVDVNSGVESAPGVKSPEKLAALAAALAAPAAGA